MNRVSHSSLALLVLLSLFTVRFASAQSNDISPYSRYGIGDLQDPSSAINFSMGGTGIAYHNDASTPFLINLKNPASYAYSYIPVEDSAGTGGLKMAAFEAGLTDNILSLSTYGTDNSLQTARSNNTYLSYIALVIPVNRHFGLGMGLTPISTEGYNITGNPYSISPNSPNQSADTAQNQYQGTGGINKVYLGLAYSPCKFFSIGGNLNYLFGNITNEEDVDFSPNAAALNTQKIENLGIHSFDADFGVMFNVTLKKYKDHSEKNWYATLGATVTPSFNIGASYSIFSDANYPNSGNPIIIDTLEQSSTNGTIKMPLMYGAGLTLKQGDRLTISVDRSGQNWSQYTYFGQNENLTDSYQWGLGVQYVPNKDFPKTYFDRIQYRVGASYGQSYLDLDNTPLVNKYVSLGVGLPIGNSNPFSHPAILNFGIQVGSFGTTSNSLLQQNYIKVMASFTFDDHWFDKRKFQ